MTLRTEFEKWVAILGRANYWCGELPAWEGLHWAFTKHAYVDQDEEWPGRVHYLAAALVDAHRRHACARLDDVIETWARVEAETHEYAREIDDTVAELLRDIQPSANATVHHTRFGALINRFAYCYVNAAQSHILGGARCPKLRNELVLGLMGPLTPYSRLVTNLNLGLVRLPNISKN